MIFRVEAVEDLGGEEPTEEGGDDIKQVNVLKFYCLNINYDQLLYVPVWMYRKGDGSGVIELGDVKG